MKEKSVENFVFYISNLAIIIFYIINLNYLKNSSYFIFFNLVIIFITSLFFIEKHKTISKKILSSNLFLLFLFNFQTFNEYISTIFKLNPQNYYIRLIYNICLTMIFLVLSGNIKKIKFQKEKLQTINKIIFASFIFSLIFITLKEYIPQTFSYETINLITILKIIISSLVIAVSELLIFIGFYYLILIDKKENIKQNKQHKVFVSILFVLFHFLNISTLKENYFNNHFYLIIIPIYIITIFFFMLINLNLFDKQSSIINKLFNINNLQTNLLIPILLHWITDLFLLLFYNL